MKYSLRILSIIVMLTLVLGSSGAGAGQVERIDVLIGFHGETKADMLTVYGVKITHEYQLIPVVAATIPETALSALKNNPGIAFCEPDSRISASQQVVPWGVDRIRAPLIHNRDITGAGIKVAVLDTGIDLSHQDLNVHGGANFVGGVSWDDNEGHGTHVAGTIAALDNSIDVIGVAPDAELYAVKVLDQYGYGSWSGLAQGIEWSILNDMNIINMSLGGVGGSTAVEMMCQAAWDAGIFLVAASGNFGVIDYPAAYGTVMAVGATDSNDDVPSWSGSGPQLDIVAPGVNILSTQIGGGTTTDLGTSMAAPHVAGIAALLWEFRDDFSNGQVWDQIIAGAIESGDPYYYGAGIADAYRTIPGLSVFAFTMGRNFVIGDEVPILIRVRDRFGEPMIKQKVDITLNHPVGKPTFHAVYTDASGEAVFTFIAQYQGTYSIKATATRQGYLSGSSFASAFVF